MSRWLRELARLQGAGQATVAVTVVSTRGSVPREAGTRMLVTKEQVIGSIGGGHLEFKAIGIARDMLAGDGHASMHRFPLGASLGQCCGGLVNLLFEPVSPATTWVNELEMALARGERCEVVTRLKGDVSAGKLLLCGRQLHGTLGDVETQAAAVRLARARSHENAPPGIFAFVGTEFFVESLVPSMFHISLFGAGHVGRALVKILAELDCQIAWIDTREGEFPADLPDNVSMIVSDAPEAEVARAPSGSYFLVMTHSHPLDESIAEAILRLGDFSYFGLIGSQTKRQLFEKRLAARGIGEAQLSAMICPIGRSAIRSKEPMAIAVTVAAELMERRERSTAGLRQPMPENKVQGLARLSGH